ncbi:MAG: HAMP domain-containing histidine kinase [Ruminococcaceae bacterium]|nr:HAMP domain-containing histidine kinase [Oscillospiraceae bacterium]
MKNPNKKLKLRLSVYFIIIVSAELFSILGASIAFSYLFPLIADDIVLPEWVLILAFSVVVGVACSIFVNKVVLSKISNLSRSMSRVAQGEFDIELKTDSKIDEIQEIYKSFNLMTRELSATEMLKSDFVSNVSHEFKTPIGAIEGYAMLLQEKNLTDEEREGYLEKILSNTGRLSDLVGNILLISKLENQSIGEKREKYRLDEQIRKTLVMLEPKWSEKELELDAELENVEYFGNEGLMFHVFNNLIGNAIKFDPRGGDLILRLQERDGYVIFTVEDSGPGINEEHMSRIFDKFYQGDSSHKGEGNGLGLSLVKRIVDLEGGTVEAENRACGGCKFKVIIKKS